MIQTIYVPDVWKDLKLEFKEEIYENINIKIDLDIDLTLLEPKGIRNSNNPRTLKTPLPNKRIYSSQLNSTIYNKSIDSSCSTNYDKRIEATKRRSAKYNEKYNERIKSNKSKKKMENNLIHHCVIS